MNLLDFTELLKLLLILLLLLAVGIYDIHGLVEVILDLTHFLSNHCFHLFIVIRNAICGSAMDLAHDLIKNLSFKLLFEVLVHCAQARQPL